MKKTILGITLLGIMVLVMAAAMVVNGRNVRKNEMDRMLDTAVEQTVAELQEEKEYRLENKNEFLADFVESLLLKVNSDSEIEVSVAGADEINGLLSIKVTEHFKHPNGKPGKVETERTVVMEQYTLDKKGFVTITYRVGDVDYKVYTLVEGSSIPVPVNPEENFVQWLDESGNVADLENMTADTDKVFVAQMN